MVRNNLSAPPPQNPGLLPLVIINNISGCKKRKDSGCTVDKRRCKWPYFKHCGVPDCSVLMGGLNSLQLKMQQTLFVFVPIFCDRPRRIHHFSVHHATIQWGTIFNLSDTGVIFNVEPFSQHFNLPLHLYIYITWGYN